MSAFLQINQQLLAELLTFIDFADNKLTIGFVCINFVKDRNTLIDIIINHEQCKNIQFEVLTFDDTELRFLKDAIVAELSNIAIQENKKLVLIIVGLEKSIGMSGEYPPVLQDLNFVRDAFTTSVPHPILFFLPDNALTRLAKYAPDVWAWRKGVFEFKTVESTKEYAIERTLNSNKMLGSLELPEKQERIDLLERLLMEATEIPNRVNILKELGVAYHFTDELNKAEDFLQQALKLTEDAENLILIRASILHEIGNTYLDYGRLDEAIILYQQSLELDEKIGNVKGKPASLHNLAGIYARQGDVDRAIALYQQSLDLNEKIGDVLGKATSLHNLAGIYAQQDDADRAISLYQQSVDLNEKIGELEGKAVSLHQLAGIYAQCGDMDEAMALYQQSLLLKEKIGDAKGKAVSLYQLAGIYVRRGDVDDAIALYQQSLELFEQIGDVKGKALTLAMLGQLLADEKQEFRTALDYLYQSFEILQHLESPGAETAGKWFLEYKLKQLLQQSPETRQLAQKFKSANEDTRSEIISRILELIRDNNEES